MTERPYNITVECPISVDPEIVNVALRIPTETSRDRRIVGLNRPWTILWEDSSGNRYHLFVSPCGGKWPALRYEPGEPVFKNPPNGVNMHLPRARGRMADRNPAYFDTRRLDSAKKATHARVDAALTALEEDGTVAKALAERERINAEWEKAKRASAHKHQLAQQLHDNAASLVVEATNALRLLDGLVEEGEIASPNNTVECLRQILSKINAPTGYEPEPEAHQPPVIDNHVPF